MENEEKKTEYNGMKVEIRYEQEYEETTFDDGRIIVRTPLNSNKIVFGNYPGHEDDKKSKKKKERRSFKNIFGF